MLLPFVRLMLTGTGFASVAINRVKRLLPNLLATGDDDGVVKVGILLMLFRHCIDITVVMGSQKTRGH